MKRIGSYLEQLGRFRGRADYDLSPHMDFATNTPAQQAIDDAKDALALLDAIVADPTRQTAAIAAIRKAFP